MQAPPTAILVVAEDGSETLVGHVPAAPPDLALVDALMRFQLDACRRGRRVRLRDPSPELRGLLELAGLGGVLGLEPRRQPEPGELLGADEVVQPDDLAG